MRRAVELDPDNWQLHLQAAHVFQSAGDDAAARASVAAALELVPPDKRNKVREYAKRMMGADVLGEGEASSPAHDVAGNLDLPDPVVSAPPPAPDGSSGPALMLGDPSSVRLRDPDQQLKLDLDE